MKYKLTSFVVAEINKVERGKITQFQTLKSSPHYLTTSAPHQALISREKIKIENREGSLIVKAYAPDVILAEITVEVDNIFSEEIFKLEDELTDQAYKVLTKKGASKEFSETYSVFVVSDYQGEPQQFFKYQNIIASLLKSERLELDPKEIAHTLDVQIQYAKNDMTIIDWDGAFVFDPIGDIDSILELLELANFHLLRYRILDRNLDERLEKMEKFIWRPMPKHFFLSFFKNKEIVQDLREIIKIRAMSISQFHALDRDIKLIGDWYSARLFDLTAKKLKTDEWRNSIKDKLESLESIYSVILENFSISSREIAEWVQIVGFFILQIGWLALIIIEFLYFTR